MTMYALLSICIGACAAYDPGGLLLYTSLTDCQANIAEEKRMGWPATAPGLKYKLEQYKLESRCATIYFSDYAQVERLLFGKVTCSYSTTIPEGAMARAASLSPYGDKCKK